MKATQRDIARLVKLDVSSVNKILNKRRGPVFRKETIRLVFKTAKKLGYDFHDPSKIGRCRLALLEIVEGYQILGITSRKLRQFKRLAYGS